MADFDCTGEYTLSVWFQPTHSGNYDTANTQAASGPLITGKDTNGRSWGLYMAGQNSLTGDGTGNYYQQVCFQFIYHDGTNPKSITNNDYASGIRVKRGQWSNIVVTKNADHSIKMRLGGADFYVNTTNHTDTMVNLTMETAVTVAPNNGNVPKYLGETVRNGMCFIGLSSMRNLIATPAATKGSMAVYTINNTTYNMACGTTDGTTAYVTTTSSAAKCWAWNIAMGEVGVFDWGFTLTDAQALFATRAVW
jgi:hypothetical protein